MLPNYAEYKRMDQDKSRGQLYNVQNAINILYKAHWLGLLIFSDINTLFPIYLVQFVVLAWLAEFMADEVVHFLRANIMVDVDETAS